MKTVKVTQKHIRRGIRCRYQGCPVSLAVGGGVTLGCIDIQGRYYIPSKSLAAVISLYDAGGPMKPFTLKFSGRYITC